MKLNTKTKKKINKKKGGTLKNESHIIKFKSSDKYKNIIDNYSGFINFKKYVKKQPHNIGRSNSFWYRLLKPDDKDHEIEIIINSNNINNSITLRYKNVFVICNYKNNLYEIRFENFLKDKSKILLPIPVKNVFYYKDIIDNDDLILSSDLINEKLLSNFNYQKRYLVNNNKQDYEIILNSLYFKFDINKNKWQTNLNNLFLLLGFQYLLVDNLLDIFINPDIPIWSFDKKISSDNQILTSKQSEIGISDLQIRVI